MSLTRSWVKESVIEVREEIFSDLESRASFFYIDTKSWHSLTNPSATKQAPDQLGDYSIPMSDGAIEWANSYHIPSAINEPEDFVELSSLEI